jgi:hypothetical protein
MDPLPFDPLSELGITHDAVVELYQKASDEVEHSNLVQAFDANSDSFRLKTI